MSDRCPCCDRGTVVITVEGPRCDRCRVIIPATNPNPAPYLGRRPRRRQDQDYVPRMTDYARTKADK